MRTAFYAESQQESHQQGHHRQHDAEDHSVTQVPSSLFKHFRSVLEFLVLVSCLKEVEIEVAVVVRGLLHAQGTVRKTQLLTYARYPLGNGGDMRVVYPLLLDTALKVIGIEGRQGVGGQLTIVRKVVSIDTLQRTGITVQRMVVVAFLEVYFTQRAVGARRLEEVIVREEEFKGMTCHRQGQRAPVGLVGRMQACGIDVEPVRMLEAYQVIGVGAFGGQQRVVLQEHCSESLQAVGLEVSQSLTTTDGVGAEQVVELLKGDIAGILSLD